MQSATKFELPKDFVFVKELIPDVVEHLRYGTEENFVGRVIEGYKRTDGAVLTRLAAESLSRISKKLNADGYKLVIYDTYRPQRAVNNFIEWAEVVSDAAKKDLYYPLVDKKDVFEKGYVAKRSGHSRGSTVDIGLLEVGKTLQPVKVIQRKFKNGREYNYLDDGTVDMGTSWDFLDVSSHYENDLVDEEITKRRLYLRGLFEEEGWKITPREWWHFTYINEPFPDTYFDFVVEKDAN